MTDEGVAYLCGPLGVKLVAAAHEIEATGPAATIEVLAEMIVAHKPALLAFLSPAPWECASATGRESSRFIPRSRTEREEAFEERAGILEYDGMTREQAECTARQELGL